MRSILLCFSVQPYLVSLVAMATLGGYAALHHGWIWARRRDLVVHREFAALALAIMAASTAAFWLHSATEDAARISADRVQWLAYLATGACLVRFVHRATASANRLAPALLQAAMAVSAALLLILPNGLLASPEHRIMAVEQPWGEVLHYVVGLPSAAYWFAYGSAAACVVWSLSAAWQDWRRTGRLPLLLSLAVIALEVGWVIRGDIIAQPATPLIIHSFTLLALVMGSVLSAAVLRQAELEDRLRRAGRHEQLGRLAAGVAHDFGNLLTGVVGNAELLADELSDRPEARERARSIASAGLAASTLTRRMLTLARGRERETAAIEIGELLAQVAALSAGSGATRPDLVLRLATPGARVEGDQAQLLSLFLNLVFNARDALAGKPGRITITTALRGPPADAKLRHTPQPVPLIEIAVADSGAGMPPEVAARLFEPFFTTKGASGTGLGLIQVDEAVVAHGGALAVASALGAGTTVRVWLPLAEGSSGIEPVQVPAGARVLVVADEVAVLQLTEAALAAIGWEVTTARPRDAARVAAGFRLSAAVIDLPDPEAVRILGLLREALPALPVVLVGSAATAPSVHCLPRPARPADIGQALLALIPRA